MAQLSSQPVTLVLLCIALGVAVVDWYSVARKKPAIEQVAKPLVMTLVALAALLAQHLEPMAKAMLMTAAVFGVLGDVALLPRFDSQKAFLAGLGSFFVGHLAYVALFVTIGDIEPLKMVLAIVPVVILMKYWGIAICRSCIGSKLFVPVVAYISITVCLVITAHMTSQIAIVLGALLFAGSDALLGHDRFVTHQAQRRLYVHILYFSGQLLIAAGVLAMP